MALHTEKNRKEDIKEPSAELENKAWYRLLKVLCFCSVILSFLAGLGVFYLYKPYREVDDIIVSCDNGLTFRAKEEGIYLFSEYVSNEEKCRLREICGRPPLIYKTHGKEFPYTCDNLPESISLDDLMKHAKDNYKIEYVYKTIGGWEKAIFYAVVTTFLLTVLSIVLEKTIVYILSGGNWWKL